jgi:hypothetical protein
MAFIPKLDTLPPSQRALWLELGTTPGMFTLYGGTALALRLGHRTSVDFDFFSNDSFDPDLLAGQVPYLRNGERVQVAPNTLTCRVDRDGPVMLSYFGGLGIGSVNAPEQVRGMTLHVASLLDIAGTKAAVVQKRAEVKDYIDIDALIRQGLDLPTILAAGRVVYGRKFNPLITLKALSYFGDLPTLPAAVSARLSKAVERVDATQLPTLKPYAECGEYGTES